MAQTFFAKQHTNSKIKTSIVASYFAGWANVITSQASIKKIGYLDFFCGPGQYEDGSDSTPIKITKAALEKSRLCDSLVLFFNGGCLVF